MHEWQVPINPYGKAKKMAEDIILDFSKRSNMAVMILRCRFELALTILLGKRKCVMLWWIATNIWLPIIRYFNVIGSDPEGMLGESPRPELREHGRISGACFDAALGVIPGLKVCQSVSVFIFKFLEFSECQVSFV